MFAQRLFIQFLAVSMKEIRQTLADRRMIGMLVVAPLIQLTVFGFAVDLDVDRLSTVIVDQDQTALSRRHIAGVLADGTLRAAGTHTDVAGAERAIDAGEATVALVVPRGFERDVERGRPTSVQAIVDGANPNESSTAQSTIARYFGRVSQRLSADWRAGARRRVLLAAARPLQPEPRHADLHVAGHPGHHAADQHGPAHRHRRRTREGDGHARAGAGHPHSAAGADAR
jgi:hypothetical protein